MKLFASYKLAFLSVTILLLLVTSCATKRDCQGNKKHYNREGGFWM